METVPRYPGNGNGIGNSGGDSGIGMVTCGNRLVNTAVTGRLSRQRGYGNVSCVCLITLRANLSGAVYCNRSCLWVCLCDLWVFCGSVTTITRNCVHPHQTGFVGKVTISS